MPDVQSIGVKHICCLFPDHVAWEKQDGDFPPSSRNPKMVPCHSHSQGLSASLFTHQVAPVFSQDKKTMYCRRSHEKCSAFQDFQDLFAAVLIDMLKGAFYLWWFWFRMEVCCLHKSCINVIIWKVIKIKRKVQCLDWTNV